MNGLGGKRLGKFFAKQIGDIPTSAQKPQRRRSARKTSDFYKVAQTIAPKPARRCHHHFVMLSRAQFVGAVNGSGITYKLKKVGLHGNGMLSRERNRHKCFGGEQALGLYDRVREKRFQAGCGKFGRGIAPATD